MPDQKPINGPDPLADRYGRNRRSRWPVVLSGLVGSAALGWLAWAVWLQSTPEITSSMHSYDIVDAHTVKADVVLRLRKADVRGTCVLRAYAADHSVVGELSFRTPAGRGTAYTLERKLRTERRATSVTLLGCTAPGQQHPR